jgi:hypothetical protein
MKINSWLVVVVGSVITTLAIAKLPAPPAPTEEQKAKAAEAKEKAAEAAKKDAADLGRYQDKSADRYFREMKSAGKAVPPSSWVPPAPVAPVAATPNAGPSATGAAAPAKTTTTAPAPAAPAKKA